MAVFFLLVLAAGVSPPPQYLEIAASVAGAGLPACISYSPDGTTGPCLPSFAVKPGGKVGGLSTNGRIVFSHAATVRLTRDEFALLAGHEIAHYYLNHRRSTPQTELAADRLGAQLACQAGFDPAAGASLFRHLGTGATHPPPAQRRAAVMTVNCRRY